VTTDPVTWDLQPHTAAKHRVLASYLAAWIPVMGQQALKAATTPRLLLVDGFAGPGVYRTGEPGSPIIILRALLGHSAFPRLGGVEFNVLFIEQDARRVASLEREVARLGELPGNIKVYIERGSFEDKFGALVDQAIEPGRRLIPTFGFIDPFGYSSASMSLTGRMMQSPRCEVLVFLPLSYIHRFVGRTGQEAALTSLFGTEDWREAIGLRGQERSACLLALFERQLGMSDYVKFVRSFQLRTEDGQDYRLVFGLAHRKGLEIAKDAMWSVDPVNGTSYVATTDSGEPVLFAPEELLDTRPLLNELRKKFDAGPFGIDDAEEVTLLDTPFRTAHLRRKTLAPAERAGIIEIVAAPAGRKRTFYPPGTAMRFAADSEQAS
jgi:three-Cys-motif partner protein